MSNAKSGKIDKNNILFAEANAIDSYNRANFASNDYYLFDFCRVYSCGRFKTIGTNPTMLQTFYVDLLTTPKELSSASLALHSSPDQHRRFHLITNDSLSPEVKALYEQHGIYNPLTCVYRHDDWVDMFTYHSPKGIQGAIDSYMNQLDVIEQHNLHLSNKLQPLFNRSKGDLIQYNPQVETFISDYFSLRKPRNPGPNHSSHWQTLCQRYGITKREQQCLRLMLRGLNTKQIAALLNISPRTVESHCAQLRQKTATPSKAALIATIHQQLPSYSA